MNLSRVKRLLRQNLWLIVLAAFLSGSVIFVRRSSRQQTLMYRAEAVVLIGNALESPNPWSGEIQLGSDLAQTYAVLIKTQDVLEMLVDRGDLPVPPDALDNMLSVGVIPNTPCLVLSVFHPDPNLAADIVNTVAEQLTLNGFADLTPEIQSQIDLVKADVETLNKRWDRSLSRLGLIDKQLEVAVDDGVIESLFAERNATLEQAGRISGSLSETYSRLDALQMHVNSLNILSHAGVPSSPINPYAASRRASLRDAAFGAAFGAALALALAFLAEYLDDTIKTPEEVIRTLDLSMLGVIIRFDGTGKGFSNRMLTHVHPDAPIRECYRILRASLLLSAKNTNKRAYIITSPGVEEGKTLTTVNLAVSMASSGLRVLLIDADLRRPRLHQIFGLKNYLGLTTLLSADPTSLDDKGGNDLSRCIQDTAVPGVRVITSGFIPLNPAEILGSARMQRWFDVFLALEDVDVILFDTPPALFLTDSAVLAAVTNVPIMMVLKAHSTRRRAAIRTEKQLAHLNVDICGCVLNHVEPVEHEYGYEYRSYHYRYYES